MNVSSLATLAAAVAALGVSIAACGTTNNNAVEHSSALGESCLTTADCMSGVCVANTCVAASGGDGGMGTSSGGSDSGTGSSSGTASSSGSSSGAASSSGAVVPEAAPPHVGARGDSCHATSDCASGLSCVPLTGFGTSGGVCDVTTYNINGAQTGKACTGECNTAADCCELPINVTIAGVTYHNCNDLSNQVIGGVSCASLSPGDTTAVGQGCFYQAVYCTCNNDWACTANQCQYTGSCMASGAPVWEGCPARTRTGRALVATTCTNNVCSAGTVTPPCNTDTDCAGQAYLPFSAAYASGSTCRSSMGTGGATDCTCHSNECYLKCSKDLDCATGYKCDSATSLCTPTGGCATDAQCATQTGNILAKCTAGACTTPCSTDSDCGGSGDNNNVSNFGGQVCVSGSCQTLGCMSDADCNLSNSPGAVHLFCETVSATAATSYASAITN